MFAPQETDDVRSFDRRSGTYEESFRQRLFFDRVHRAALALMPPDGDPVVILDIGCGTGRLLRKMASRWPAAQLVGVDPAEGMVAEARRLTPGASFYVGPAEQLPLPDMSADLVLTTVSFHHWQDQARGIREIARVLRPGGRYLIADMILPYGLSKVVHHGRPAPPSVIGPMLAEAGLSVDAQRHLLGRFVLLTSGTRA